MPKRLSMGGLALRAAPLANLGQHGDDRGIIARLIAAFVIQNRQEGGYAAGQGIGDQILAAIAAMAKPDAIGVGLVRIAQVRSEERRVGKECSQQCRSRWSPYH